MSDPTVWPPMKVHPRIVKAGIREYFTAPYDITFYRPRGDSVGLFNQLVKNSTFEELETKVQQFVETYSHYMWQIEKDMKIEQQEATRQRHLSYDRKLLSTAGDVIHEIVRSQEILKSERKEAAARKRINFALEEQSRIGILTGMLFKHLISVRVTPANRTDDLCDCDICKTPV